MPRAENETRKLLKVERGWERSRLEEQLLAVAYDLVTPLVRRVLPLPSGDQSPRPRTSDSAITSPRRGGTHA